MRASEVQELIQRANEWARDARDAGWLDATEARRFEELERRSPGDLFVKRKARPLVVGLFGGTGAGKSSLLNRLADEVIARTGVERPTSREVTLYVHNSVELADLPEAYPAERTRIARHGDEQRRNIVWLDMPDIDSVETANRDLALSWLKYIDLLIYVVSPERYRDDAGWRVLRERGHRHAWMFVMNHWDEGETPQVEDFKSILRDAGFNEPLVLRTSCAPGSRVTDDEFDRIESAIHAVLAEHSVQELARLGHAARLEDTREVINAALERLGTQQQWANFNAENERNWQQTRRACIDNLGWPMQQLASRLADTPATDRIMRKLGLGKSDETEEVPENQKIEPAEAMLWDEWSQTNLVETLSLSEIEIAHASIASTPIQKRLSAVADAVPTLINDHLQQALRRGLAKPGTALQRGLRGFTGFLRTVLPLAALVWVGYTVVTRFYAGATGEGEFLDVNFAINSAMLVLVSWLIPQLLHRKLRPSLEKTALRALNAGLEQGLGAMGERAQQAFIDTDKERTQFAERAQTLLTQISERSAPVAVSTDDSLSRLLAEPQERGSWSVPEPS